MQIFEATLQKTHLWLKDIEAVMRTDDRAKAYAALRSVLIILRECLPAEAAAKLAAQLPLLITGVFFHGWKPRAKPARLTKQNFYRELREQLRGHADADPGLAARAVFYTVERHVSEGEVAALKASLPREVRAVWEELTQDRPMREAHAEHGLPAPDPHEPPALDTGAHAWQPGWAARLARTRASSGGTTAGTS